jgi:hypothetical protein
MFFIIFVDGHLIYDFFILIFIAKKNSTKMFWLVKSPTPKRFVIICTFVIVTNLKIPMTTLVSNQIVECTLIYFLSIKGTTWEHMKLKVYFDTLILTLNFLALKDVNKYNARYLCTFTWAHKVRDLDLCCFKEFA